MESTTINETGDAKGAQEHVQKREVKKVMQEELSEDENDELEEIVLDEASDTENYEPLLEESDDDEPSSGEEEEIGVLVERPGYCKLQYGDEQNRIELSESLELAQDEKDEKVEENNIHFGDYRIIDADMSDYNSDEDEHFNPVACGQTLSDIEYGDSDEHDTESENEIEDQDAIDKRTGETLKCLRMIENLKIPPAENNEAKSKIGTSGNTENIPQMECS